MAQTTTRTSRPVKAMCEWCGSAERVQALKAIDQHTGRGVVLHLCGSCREGDNRTWRLRYAPETSQ